MMPRKEKMSGPATVSLVLHGALVALAVFPLGFRSREPLWGGEGSSGQAVSVTLKSSIPLPAAAVENPLASDTKSENLPEPAKPEPKTKPIEPPPNKNDYLINDKKAKQQRLQDAKNSLLAEASKDLKRESNAVPGSGGRASSQMYGMAAPSAGSGGIGFGGDFGSRYSFYVRTVQTCLSNHWQQTRPDTMVANVPKAYVAFEILKDGSIANEHVSTSSGIPSVDRDAIGSVVGCSGRSGADHLPALPRDFEAARVPVEVWFATKQ